MITKDVETSNLSFLQRYVGKTIEAVKAQHREAETIVSPDLKVYFTDGSCITISTSEWMNIE